MYKNLSLVYDRLMDVDYESYKKIITSILNNKKNLKSLDLGCGSGALTSKIGEYGEVFAVDISEEMLVLANEKYPKAKYFIMDLLNINSLEQEFDFILSAFDVFNYLENFDDFKKALLAVYNSLKDGGIFLFDIHTPAKINYMLDNEVFAYEEEDLAYIWYTYPTDNELEVESELSFYIEEREGLYKKMYEYQKQRSYEIEDIMKEIGNIGFKIDKYFCDFDESNKDYEKSHRIIFLLSK
ncbi:MULTISPECIES: class I SAM-dependent methyltransferase [unclassified Gemella]|uniref:class I SAM-dependent DNA methyltransferase n=1 Tax=unclassified Gemella TaxID=2624949 RepID=UPI0015D0B585|nr:MULTISPECIES: class I SAM-dependent methyltransferase [unclassified Gemella]MBF0710718.1 class I SAM-dependent methyltransferase [Gemella sp. GL1.1]NYS28062.1 class I SAM-dependent methyltransferase [Gemella sp. GL1]